MASRSLFSVYPSTALTDSAVGSSVKLENGWSDFVGYIKATSVNGATTLDCDIEHSPDGTNWYVKASFTQIVGSDSNEIITVAAPLCGFVRANITLAGATKAATVEVQLAYDSQDVSK